MVTSVESKSFKNLSTQYAYLWRMCLSIIEEPEKKPDTMGGLADDPIWGDS